MTYRGERSRFLATEEGRVFEVSKVRLSADGHVRDVLWGEVDTASGQLVGPRMEVSAADVLDAIHDGAQVVALFERPKPHLRKRGFIIVLHEDSQERLSFEGSPRPGRELVDMSRLEPAHAETAESVVAASSAPPAKRKPVHAVSQVELDADGRVTRVFWGQVDPVKNDWAKPEVVSPVGKVVDALNAGHQVFALFPTIHGHLPDRQFMVANYDGGLRTIVLDGPATHEREIHHMDRLAATG